MNTEKKIYVKTFGGYTETFNVGKDMGLAELKELILGDMCEKELMDSIEEKNITFVINGKILKDSNLSNIDSESTLVCVISNKLKKTDMKENERELKKTDMKENERELKKTDMKENTEVEQSEKQYTFEECHASVIVLLKFVGTHQELRNLFITNNEHFLAEIQMNLDILGLFRGILNNSKEIANAMKNGDNYIGKFSSKNEGCMHINEEDKKNIEELISMGFEEDEIISKYFVNGKNFEKTFESLL
jgi:hypothetical protein